MGLVGSLYSNLHGSPCSCTGVCTGLIGLIGGGNIYNYYKPRQLPASPELYMYRKIQEVQKPREMTCDINWNKTTIPSQDASLNFVTAMWTKPQSDDPKRD
jgi:hypothetical protein